MSFAGHVYDMIRRNKEDREKLRQLRKPGVDGRLNYSSRIPDISVEEFEQIQEQTKERERQEKRYFFRIAWLFFCIALVILFMIIIFSHKAG